MNMGLDKVSRVLLVKLFYQNNNSAAAHREYRRIKGIRRGSLSVPRLNMIRSFELTDDLGIAPGRGRRPIALEIVKKLLLPWLRMLDAMCDLQAAHEQCHES